MNIQRAIGGLVNELSEEGFTSKLIDTYWAKGAAIVLCQDKETQDCNEGMGGLQAGGFPLLQDSGGLVSGPLGGHGMLVSTSP